VKDATAVIEAHLEAARDGDDEVNDEVEVEVEDDDE